MEKIIKTYHELIGVDEALFVEKMRFAQELSGEDMEKIRCPLEIMIEEMSDLKPRQIKPFLERCVQPGTFLYPLNFGQVFSKYRHELVKDFIFHILSSEKFQGIGDKLIPEYLLKGKKFNQKYFEEGEQDYYSVCFAESSLGKLSRFLAGFIFTESENIDDLVPTENCGIPEEISNPNSVYFPFNYEILVAENSLPREEDGPHEIFTRYSLNDVEDHINVRISTSPVRVFKINVPYIALTPERILGVKADFQKIFHSSFLGGDYIPETEEEVERIYIAERRYEDSIFYAIYDLLKREGKLN